MLQSMFPAVVTALVSSLSSARRLPNACRQLSLSHWQDAACASQSAVLAPQLQHMHQHQHNQQHHHQHPHHQQQQQQQQRLQPNHWLQQQQLMVQQEPGNKARHDPQEENQGTQQQAEGQQAEQQGQQQQPEMEQPLEGPNGLLAEWRTESARWYSKVFYLVVDSSLNFPQFCTWAELYRSKPPGLLRRLLVPQGCSNLTWPLHRMYSQHSLISEFLLSQAHADFDADSFKAGVKQALEYSTALYAASDWVSLKPLVSAALLQSMRNAREEQAAQMDADDVTLSDVELVISPESVRLVSASALTRDQMASLDQQRASDFLPLIPVAADDEESATVDAAASAACAAASAATASPVAEGAADQTSWDLAHVYAEGVLHTRVTKGSEPPRQVDLPKRGHYVLCRGPVHVDRMLTADVAEKTPWFLLTWL